MTTLLLRWRPVAARVIATDFSEREPCDDRRSGGFTAGTLRGFRWGDGEDCRLIRDDVIFDDRDGIRHRASADRQVPRGQMPYSVHVL